MSKEDNCTVYADLDGYGHCWSFLNDNALECVFCGATEKVKNVEGFSEEDAPEWPDSKPIGLDKYT